VSRYDASHVLHLGILTPPENSRTSDHDDLRSRVFSFDAPHKAPGLGVGGVRHSARVHDTHIG
jgi:hypothetical protein